MVGEHRDLVVEQIARHQYHATNADARERERERERELANEREIVSVPGGVVVPS